MFDIMYIVIIVWRSELSQNVVTNSIYYDSVIAIITTFIYNYCYIKIM